MMKFNRILLKLSGESLMGAQKYGIDVTRVESYARQIKEIAEMGIQIGIVIGGGNIFRGLSGTNKGFDRVKGDSMGMLATVINSLALSSALDNENCRNKVLTAIRMEPIGEFYSKAKAIEYLENGYVTIFSAGTGNPYFTTDTGSSLRAIEIEADAMLKGTRVDGIYTADPEKDPTIPYNFSVKNLAGKKKDKEALQKKFGLPVKPDVPLIGIVSRLTYQKGFQLVSQEMSNLMQFNVQLVVLGTGYDNFEHDFRYFSGRYPEKCSACIDFDVELAQQIYAGCDMFLMPSAFEPCGLSQMISMRYGTLPIVHQIGGLRDSVWAYNPIEGVGTGFGFEEFGSFWMMEEIKQALNVYNNQPKVWASMMKTAMTSDFSWDSASQNYLDLYGQILR